MGDDEPYAEVFRDEDGEPRFFVVIHGSTRYLTENEAMILFQSLADVLGLDTDGVQRT